MIGNEIQLTPLLGASGVEFLVVLLLMAGSAIFNWWQKRKQGGQDEWSGLDRPQPPTRPGSPPQPTTNWEEELRRMLEGQTPTAPPPQAPPPVIREHRPTPPPIPRPSSVPTPPRVPQPIHSVKTYRGHCEHCQGHIEFPTNLMGDDIRCPHCNQQTRLYPYSETAVERRAHRAEGSPVLSGSSAPTLTAAQQALAARFAESAPRSSHAATVHRREITGEVQEVVSMFRSPRTARQAVIASIILNPPKALEG